MTKQEAEILANRIEEFSREQPEAFASIIAANEARWAKCSYSHLPEVGFCNKCGWNP